MGAPKIREFDERPHAASGLAASAVAAQASRILASEAFRKSRRLSRFLAYAVENTLASNEDVLKETVLGIEVFDRGPGFDPQSDAIVRIDARRLRSRIAEYYASEGASDPIVIEFEPGSYVPRFRSSSNVEEAQVPGRRATGLTGIRKLGRTRRHAIEAVKDTSQRWRRSETIELNRDIPTAVAFDGTHIWLGFDNGKLMKL
jgi:hypothetical protein